MPSNLRIEFILLVLIIGIIVILTLRAKNLTLKYALVWLAAVFAMLLGLIIPNFIELISKALGFEVLANMVFFCGFLVISGIVFSLTVIVSRQSDKIRLLIQEVSILKKETKNKNEKQTK